MHAYKHRFRDREMNAKIHRYMDKSTNTMKKKRKGQKSLLKEGST